MPLIRRSGRPGLLGLAARTAVVAGTATAVGGGIRRYQQQKAQSEYEQEQYEAARQHVADAGVSPQTEAPSDTAGADMVAELQKLAELKRTGSLTEAEFESAKARLLG